MTKKIRYRALTEHYERCLEEHGDTHLGVDWPNLKDADTRYQVMLGLIKKCDMPSTLLDLGCGTAALLQRLDAIGEEIAVTYEGLDISERFIDVCKGKYPSTKFHCRDILKAGMPGFYDYVVMNGLFTEKRELSFEEMWWFCQSTLALVAVNCKKGFAFNVMSSHVDWTRDDLFHLPLDTLVTFLSRKISRNIVIRSDYGLYEYTVYVYL